ncbi:tRNA A37 threonylcarbamoyladenosine dehydratase [Desulfonispora thiosulfatigenes DSM 11270]|uniref:tRNA A37 threonylcarbamoyladenosine dehydratase n=1 Tax=Desulfonispora thiosulfatigenes DSM 11270 TaxID=656914 RepID=A0A1W1VRX7_DESTI|nr:tRNA threonylcarbamoyladenosine dehydratase [Desulfonispora thiosulfatigenes]SMB95664.1 tRNA A37 threonylcarbamoyladenosine dehydratase [Desulfonispora thiosulfatigenes DSM 11270]
MEKALERTTLLIGDKGLEKLTNSSIAVIGVGGVGSYVVEALARCGVGNLLLVDHDIIDVSNINRQIHALTSTIGLSKVDVMKNRIKDINPNCKVEIKKEFCTPENVSIILNKKYDYIIDAIDYVKGKIAIIELAKQKNINVISSMGTANKLNNKSFEIVDVSKTHSCPLAKVMRKELRQKGIDSGVKVIYSPIKSIKIEQNDNTKEKVLGSISFVPPVAGLLLAGEVINDLLFDSTCMIEI